MSVWNRIKAALAPSDVAIPRVLTPRPLSQQFSRVGGGLTPQQVSSIILSADAGNVCRLVDLANEARQKDGHLQSILGTREMAVTRLPWKMVAPEAPTVREQEATEFAERAWAGAVGGVESDIGVSDALHKLQQAVYLGFSVVETRWALDGGRLVPGGFWWVPPRRFVFALEDGSLRHADFGRTSAAVDLSAAFPGKFVQHQPIVNGDVPAREGLARVLMWSALFRNWTLRDWLTLAEIGWKPWRLGKYRKGANQEDIDALQRALDSLTTTGTATLPEAAELEVKWPGGQVGGGGAGRSAHSELHGKLGEDMSKAVLGQVLTSDSGERGTKALGQVHERVREDIRDADAWALASTLQRDLIRPLIGFNYAADVRAPALVPVTNESVDRLDFAEAIERLHGVGLRIPQQWVRSEAGVPEPEAGDELLPIPVEFADDDAAEDDDRGEE